MSENLERFIEDYNSLVIGEDKVGQYHIITQSDGEMWHTLPSPQEPDRVRDIVNGMAQELPTGNHSIRVQAIGTKGNILGQCGISIEGRSATAKRAANEQIQHAKALQMNITTAEGQLVNMSARLQAADQRAQEAEERAGSMVSEVYKMADIVHSMMQNQEALALDREERQARMVAMQTIAETLAPIIGQAVVIGSKYMEHKVKLWEKQWAEEASNKETSNNPNNQTTEPN